MAEQHRYESIDRAFQDFRTPFENRAFVQRIVEAIPISDYFRTTGYIRAVRADGGPDLRIYAGGTGGFVSEDEILEKIGDVHRWRSERNQGTLWGVTHPIHGTNPEETALGGGTPKRSGGICPSCFGGELSLSGECPICGYQTED
jgi:hypothetical protein